MYFDLIARWHIIFLMKDSRKFANSHNFLGKSGSSPCGDPKQRAGHIQSVPNGHFTNRTNRLKENTSIVHVQFGKTTNLQEKRKINNLRCNLFSENSRTSRIDFNL